MLRVLRTEVRCAEDNKVGDYAVKTVKKRERDWQVSSIIYVMVTVQVRKPLLPAIRTTAADWRSLSVRNSLSATQFKPCKFSTKIARALMQIRKAAVSFCADNENNHRSKLL